MAVDPVLLSRFEERLSGQRAALAAALVALWESLSGYDRADVAEFERRAAPSAIGAKAAAVAASSAFYSRALGVRPVAIRAVDVPVVAKTQAPFHAMWHALKEGRDGVEAWRAGRSVAQAEGFNFVQSTARRTGDLVARSTGRNVRWERIPDSGACKWCETVAGRLYSSAESADFGHERCGCMVAPVVAL